MLTVQAWGLKFNPKDGPGHGGTHDTHLYSDCRAVEDGWILEPPWPYRLVLLLSPSWKWEILVQQAS